MEVESQLRTMTRGDFIKWLVDNEYCTFRQMGRLKYDKPVYFYGQNLTLIEIAARLNVEIA